MVECNWRRRYVFYFAPAEVVGAVSSDEAASRTRFAEEIGMAMPVNATSAPRTRAYGGWNSVRGGSGRVALPCPVRALFPVLRRELGEVADVRCTLVGTLLGANPVGDLASLERLRFAEQILQLFFWRCAVATGHDQQGENGPTARMCSPHF